ncbi:MAG: winged helix-turn-helix transcriptional regulator [Muribaculum sp.]|nr:winged helix-turn-helix transcriptional regulator [Muribaculum sp.]
MKTASVLFRSAIQRTLSAELNWIRLFPIRPEPDQKNKIIEILRKKPTITRSNLADELGLHESSVKRRLEALVKEHRLKRVGPDNGGYWEIIES